MNPDTNEFEALKKIAKDETMEDLLEKVENSARELKSESWEYNLVRPNGEPVPKHWPVFAVGEMVAIKDYTFKVAHIGKDTILFEPIGPVIIGNQKD